MVAVRFPDSGLTTEYGDIILSSVAGSVLLEVKYGGVLILQEGYSTDASLSVYIRDLGQLAAMYIPSDPISLATSVDTGKVVLEVKVTDGSVPAAPVTKNVTFYKSDIDFNASISTASLLLMPLSRSTTKMTGTGRKEYLSFYGDGTVKVYAVYSNGTRDVSSLKSSFATLGNSGKLCRVDVSPSVIATAVGCAENTLIYYSVYKDMGSIVQFKMDGRNHTNKTTFLFRNAFNAQETLTCIGHTLTDRKWEREYGQMHNALIQTSREKAEEISVNTGYLLPSILPVLDDLLNSDYVYVINGGVLQQVVILSEDFTQTSRKSEPRSFEITYRYASNNIQSQYVPLVRTGKIFDETFDDTFE